MTTKSDMVAAVQLLEEKHCWLSVCCAGHTLQLIDKSVLKYCSITKAASVARNLMEHIREAGRYKIEEEAAANEHQRAQAVPDRQFEIE